MGLNDERRRCNADAVNATQFCEQHQPTESSEKRIHTRKSSPNRNVIGFLRPSSNPNLVPDDTKYSLPSKLQKGKIDFVINELLNNPSPMLRWSAALALRKRREPIAIEPLWQRLNNDPVSFVRQQSAVALGKIGTPLVIAPLLDALWHDTDAGVRQACAVSLGNLGYISAVPHIVDKLEHENAGFVRWDCIIALGQLGNAKIIPLLEQLAKTEKADVICRACLESIREIRARESDYWAC
jgi:hypothetical protein